MCLVVDCRFSLLHKISHWYSLRVPRLALAGEQTSLPHFFKSGFRVWLSADKLCEFKKIFFFFFSSFFFAKSLLIWDYCFVFCTNP